MPATMSNTVGGGTGFFLTQNGNKTIDTVSMDELQKMLNGSEQASQSTLLLKKRREVSEVDDALEFMKEEYHQRMEKCDQRQLDFERRQAEMKDQVLKFEKFIQENDAKRARAESKSKQEKRLLEQKELDLRRLTQELEAAMAEEGKLRDQRQRLKRYQVYLTDTITASEQEFEEISDLLSRFTTLRDANGDLKALCSNSEAEMERRKFEMQQFRQDRQNALLVQNSSLNEYQEQLEAVRSAVKRTTDECENEADRVKGISREAGQVVTSVKNLYLRCKQTMRNSVPDAHEKREEDRRQQLERCLTIIGERVEDLADVEYSYSTRFVDENMNGMPGGNSVVRKGIPGLRGGGNEGDRHHLS